LPAIAEEDARHPLSGGKIWHRKKDDILDPERCPQWFLDEQRKLQGPRYFNAQYQQNPGVPEGSLIDLGWFGQFDEMPPRREFLKVVQSWDLAITTNLHSDYSAGITCGFRDGQWHVLEIIRTKLPFGKLLDRIVAAHQQWKADALVLEGNSIGDAMFDQVRARNLPGLLRAPKVSTSKLDRLAACTAILEAGDFMLPATAPWLSEFKRELLCFPEGPNDDQVDAFSQLIQFIFDSRRWVETTYDRHGRPCGRPSRGQLRPFSY
jgi:predicted phage terminase large subunit-like protein